MMRLRDVEESQQLSFAVLLATEQAEQLAALEDAPAVWWRFENLGDLPMLAERAKGRYLERHGRPAAVIGFRDPAALGYSIGDHLGGLVIITAPYLPGGHFVIQGRG